MGRLACLALLATACADPGGTETVGTVGGTGETTPGESSTTGEAGLDSGSGAAGSDDDPQGDSTTGDEDPPEPDDVPVAYPADRTHSPITPYVADQWHSIAASNAALFEDVFMKTGASSTVSTSTLHCFADGPVELGAHRSLDPTLQFFGGGDAAGTTPFDGPYLMLVVACDDDDDACAATVVPP